MIDAEKTRLEYGYEVTCAACGTKFESTRYDAAYCSSTCRSKAKRAKGQLDREIAAARAAVDVLVQRLPPVGAGKTFNALMDIQTRIGKALALVESE